MIMWHHSSLTGWQRRFIERRSCVTQLVLTYHHWAKCLDQGRQTNVVFLDFAKAFDRVPRDILLQKCLNFGIGSSLLNWCVIINGQHSSWSSVTSGVPQGSILGPIFFLLYLSVIFLPSSVLVIPLPFKLTSVKLRGQLTILMIMHCYKKTLTIFGLGAN